MPATDMHSIKYFNSSWQATVLTIERLLSERHSNDIRILAWSTEGMMFHTLCYRAPDTYRP